jgi:hypothetical protein
MKWSVDLDAIHREASSVVTRLTPLMGAAKEGPGGLMLPLA